MALKWAKVSQRIQPTHAWAYAMEAKHASSNAARERALGFVLYLDPLSERAALAPMATREKASQWFKTHNPFRAGPDQRKAGAQSQSAPIYLQDEIRGRKALMMSELQ